MNRNNFIAYIIFALAAFAAFALIAATCPDASAQVFAWDSAKGGQVDSLTIKNGGVSATDLANPLRYTGDMTAKTLGVGNKLTLPNAKTVFSIYPTAAQGDTLASFRQSGGTTKAWVDSAGLVYVSGIGATGTGVNINGGSTGNLSIGSIYAFSGGTAAAPVIITGWPDTDTGLYSVGPNRLGISAKGANVATFDSTGVAVTGAITGSKAIITTDANVNLTSGQSGSTRIAYEITALRADTLASCASGLFYDFGVSDTDSLVIAAAAGDTILDGTVKNTRTSTVNGTCRLLGISENIWIMLNKTGTWTPYDN